MSWSSVTEIVGFCLGVLYLYYEYKANARVWIVSLLMTLVSMQVYYSRGLYADFAMNIYYVVMAVYGYVTWTFHLRKRKKPELPIRRAGVGVLIWCAVALAGVYALIAAWLILFTDSTVPYFDAFTTAMSIIATWMLARKYIQQWLAWLAVDAVCVGLYAYKGIYLYALLYGAYTVVAWLGYRKWLRLMRQAEIGNNGEVNSEEEENVKIMNNN